MSSLRENTLRAETKCQKNLGRNVGGVIIVNKDDEKCASLLLSPDYEKSQIHDMKASLQERYHGLNSAGKGSLLDVNDPAIYVKVKQATNCMTLNKPISSPVAYEDYCAR
jgi:hypothetical protein